MPSNHLILCCTLFLPPSIFPRFFHCNSILFDLLLLISLYHYEKIASILNTDGIGLVEKEKGNTPKVIVDRLKKALGKLQAPVNTFKDKERTMGQS